MHPLRIGRSALPVMFAIACLSANAQDISLKTGESVDLHPVYWQENCISTLKGIAGVDILDGPPGIELTIREESVTARRQNCPNKLPGGVVVLTAREISQQFSGTIKYRVRYKTDDGDRQSSHSRKIALFPN